MTHNSSGLRLLSHLREVLRVVLIWVILITLVIVVSETRTYSYSAMAKWSRTPPTKILLLPESEELIGVLGKLKNRLEAEVKIPIEIGGPFSSALPMLSESQVDAGTFLDRALSTIGEPGVLLQLVTAKPISLGAAPSIFALQARDQGKMVGIISLSRLATKAAGDEAKRDERLFKVALHNLGFSFGFPGTRAANCVMRSFDNTTDLDRAPAFFCGEELQHLKRLKLVRYQ